MFDALISIGSGASGLGPLGDLYDTTEMELMQLTQRIRPAYGFTRPADRHRDSSSCSPRTSSTPTSASA